MPSNEQMALEIEGKLRAQHVELRGKLVEFLSVFGSSATTETKRTAFFELVGRATDFFNECEQSVADTSLLGAHRNEAWVQNKAETSLAVLATILDTHTTLNAVIPVLELPHEVGRPSEMAYAGLQRLVSMFFPDRVDGLRASYLAAQLPVTGFASATEATETQRAVASLIMEWAPFAEDLDRAMSSQPMGFLSRQKIAGQLAKLESEGARLIALHTPWLSEQWIALTTRRQPQAGGLERRAFFDAEVSVAVIAAEIRERIAILEAVRREVDRLAANAESKSTHYFHVFAQDDSVKKGAVSNDLTEERLMAEVVEPLLAGKSVRIDGRAITADCPVIKIARTERVAAWFAREHDAKMQKRGISALGTDRRQLPFEHGADVTNKLLGAREQNAEKSPMTPAKPPSGDGDQEPHVPRWFPTAAFVVGVVFVILVLVLATAVPNPTPQTYTLYRIVMAIGCAGFATALTGFIAIRLRFGTAVALMAGGSLAVFVIVYFWDPASGIAARGNTPAIESPAHGIGSGSAP